LGGSVRIIAGALGGRRLIAPRGRSTRPTSDRVREALFSMLGDVTGAEVLDLYAGTGALGIEALSRGARRAVFVESARPALSALRDNLASLDLAGLCRVLGQPVAKAVAELHEAGPFDLIFLDPPYAALPEASSVLSRLPELVSAGGRVILEHSSRAASPSVPGLARCFTRTYGDTAITLYRREDESVATSPTGAESPPG
jgi:16S rRNA (guanine966-N2)-methyltransferase